MSLIQQFADAQTTYPLYKGKIPNSKPNTVLETPVDRPSKRTFISNTTQPRLIAFLPEKNATGTAVIICPGGGYSGMAIQHEGEDVAREFQKIGVAAFVLFYRTPLDATMNDKSIGPLQDAQQAIKMVRERAAAWHIDAHKIGIMGFSAGGHLASTLGTHYEVSLVDNQENTSLRPDFMLLIYPVISLSDRLAHMGSRVNLIGKNPEQQQIDLYSNELQVTKDTPITFLVHAGDDKAVPVGNSLAFYQALQQQEVPAGVVIYPKGGHGFGLVNPTTPDKWFDHAVNWLSSNKLLPEYNK
ncbi:alpha/beta hydrolase [Pedobacter sp. AW31-3R]|uniref:alpha/beta hydrolase n=1 Tax=Pedobacter sp. AW31-3R TaxID=3445781 RepID=UPI003FA17055